MSDEMNGRNVLVVLTIVFFSLSLIILFQNYGVGLISFFSIHNEECTAADLNGDEVIDVKDYRFFVKEFNGEGILPLGLGLPSPDYDGDNDVDYMDYVSLKQCKTDISCRDGDLNGDGSVNQEDIDILLSENVYTGPDNIPVAIEAVVPSGLQNVEIGEDVVINIVANDEYQLSYKITCIKKVFNLSDSEGTRGRGCTISGSLLGAAVSSEGIFKWTPGTDIGLFEFLVNVSENVPVLIGEDDERFKLKSDSVNLLINVTGGSIPVFTSVQINGAAVTENNDVDSNDTLNIGVNDERGIANVEIFFEGYGHPKGTDTWVNATYNSIEDKWKYRFGDFEPNSQDYHVSITAINNFGVKSSFERFNIYGGNW